MTEGNTRRPRGEPSGVVGNERLTALIGAVVLVLSVAEIATVPTVGSLIVAHFFVGAFLRWRAPDILIRVHIVSFLIWLATLAVHVFAYVRLAAIAAVLLLPTAAPWEGWRGQAVTGPGVLAVAVSIGTAVAVMLKRR